MEFRLFGRQFDLDANSIDRIQQTFNTFLEKSQMSQEQMDELTTRLLSYEPDVLYNEMGVDPVIIMKLALETSKELTLKLNDLLDFETKMFLFLDPESLVYSRVTINDFKAEDVIPKLITTDEDSVYYEVEPIVYLSRLLLCIMLDNNYEGDKRYVSATINTLRDGVAKSIITILSHIEKMIIKFKGNLVPVNPIEDIIINAIRSSNSDDDVIKIYRSFVNEDPNKSPAIKMSDAIISEFSHHKATRTDYMLAAIMINMLFDPFSIEHHPRFGEEDFNMEEELIGQMDAVTDYLNMFIHFRHSELDDPDFDIAQLHLNPMYIIQLFKLNSGMMKTGLSIIDNDDEGIYKLLTLVLSDRKYIEFLEVINCFIDVEDAINTGKSVLTDLSIIPLLLIELKLNIEGKIDYAITNDTDLYVFRYNDRIQYGDAVSTYADFMKSPIVGGILESHNSIISSLLYSESIRDCLTLYRFIQRNLD